MKTAFLGFILAAAGAGLSHPNDNDISSWWLLAGIGVGMIVGRIFASFSNNHC